MEDGASFDRIVAWSGPAMVVVTASADGERSGCLVGFWSQCGIDRRRAVVWISRLNHTHGVARRSTHLGVHHLAAGQHRLADHFGSLSGDDTDKFAGLDTADGPGGVPVLSEVGARWVGRVLTVLDVDADHDGFLLEPVGAGGADPVPGHPLRLPDVGDVDPAHPA